MRFFNILHVIVASKLLLYEQVVLGQNLLDQSNGVTVSDGQDGGINPADSTDLPKLNDGVVNGNDFYVNTSGATRKYVKLWVGWKL